MRTAGGIMRIVCLQKIQFYLRLVLLAEFLQGRVNTGRQMTNRLPASTTSRALRDRICSRYITDIAAFLKPSYLPPNPQRQALPRANSKPQASPGYWHRDRHLGNVRQWNLLEKRLVLTAGSWRDFADQFPQTEIIGDSSSYASRKEIGCW